MVDQYHQRQIILLQPILVTIVMDRGENPVILAMERDDIHVLFAPVQVMGICVIIVKVLGVNIMNILAGQCAIHVMDEVILNAIIVMVLGK